MVVPHPIFEIRLDIRIVLDKELASVVIALSFIFVLGFKLSFIITIVPSHVFSPYPLFAPA